MRHTRRRSFPWGVVVGMGAVVGAVSFAVFGPPSTSAAVVVQVPSTRVAAPAPAPTTTGPPAATPASEPAPATTSTTVTERGELVIQGVGDVSFDPAYIAAFREVGYEAAFEGLDGILLEDDLTVINLECPVTDVGAPADKAYSFRCDPAALPIAAAHGVDVANLANNHGQDRGTEGMLDSVDQLDWAGITAVGVGSDIHRAMTAAYFDIDGWTVAVLGMGGVVPGEGWLADEDRPGMASGDDVEQMGAAVAAADQRADVVVVTIHWGRELVTEPDPLDRERAEAMVEAGADVVFGHHAHRLGAMEMIGDTPVFWTLGNFIWPRLSAAGAVSAVARVTLSPDGSVGACLVPVEIEESGRPRLTDGSECPEE